MKINIFANLVASGFVADKEGQPCLQGLLLNLTQNLDEKNAFTVLSFFQNHGCENAGVVSQNLHQKEACFGLDHSISDWLSSETKFIFKGLLQTAKHYFLKFRGLS